MVHYWIRVSTEAVQPGVISSINSVKNIATYQWYIEEVYGGSFNVLEKWGFAWETNGFYIKALVFGAQSGRPTTRYSSRLSNGGS